MNEQELAVWAAILQTANNKDGFKIESFLFDKQLAFVNDPAPFKTAVCSRRSGKTVSCAADLIDTALKNPDTVSIYITLSRNNAKKIIWPELLKLNRLYGLGGVPDNTELSIKFPNESTVYCSGAKDRTEIEKFRGLPVKKAYVDECQSFRDHIGSLIDDILARVSITEAVFLLTDPFCLPPHRGCPFGAPGLPIIIIVN